MGIFGPVRINQTVEIEISLLSGPVRYKSRVEGISDYNLVVAAPMVNGQVVPIKVGTEIIISFLDNVALYTFNTVIVSTNLKPVPTITLDKPHNVKRVQRRNFVRIDAKIPITYYQLKQTLERCSQSMEGTTLDISGGGTMFSTTEKLDNNNLLELNFEFPDGSKVIAVGKIVRIFEKRLAQKLMYSVGIEFTIIEESERDKIIRFIFNQQRELRRKGLL